MLSFLDKLISSHLNVLVEQVTSKDLLSIFVIDGVAGPEEESKSALSHELIILVVEEGIVIVEENKLYIELGVSLFK